MSFTKASLIAILAAQLSGCATTLHSIPDDYRMGAGPGSVLVGHVTIDLGAKPVEFFDNLDRISLTVENRATSEEYEIVSDQTGSDSDFFVALPPGQYEFSRVVKGNLTNTSRGHFNVPPSQVVYFGTMKFTGDGFGNSIGHSVLSGHPGVVGGWASQDDFDKASARFGSRHPQINRPIVKSLVVIGR